jgi:YjbE family integral membrane protein
MPWLSLADAFTPGGLAALSQVVVIDLTLAGDNVVILGTVAAGLPADQRKRVMTFGIGMALVCLTGLALVATRLLHVIGLTFAGGLLLLWVAWRLWRETGPHHLADAAPTATSFARAAVRVALADLSMSLDNVLAVAGAARAHPAVLFFGLGLSVTLTAIAAGLIARLIARHRWIGHVGLAVIVVVAVMMIHDGWANPATGLRRLWA